jgi:hypothetical protein
MLTKPATTASLRLSLLAILVLVLTAGLSASAPVEAQG